jgi:hypothetical protein
MRKPKNETTLTLVQTANETESNEMPRWVSYRYAERGVLKTSESTRELKPNSKNGKIKNKKKESKKGEK